MDPPGDRGRPVAAFLQQVQDEGLQVGLVGTEHGQLVDLAPGEVDPQVAGVGVPRVRVEERGDVGRRGEQVRGEVVGVSRFEARRTASSVTSVPLVGREEEIAYAREVLERVNRELGTLTAVITHNASIAGMGDRVIRMSSGRIIDIAANERRLPASELQW